VSKARKPRFGKPGMSARLTAGGAVASAGILALSLVAAPPDSHGARTEARAVQLVALALPLAAPSGALLEKFISDNHAQTFVPVVSVGGDATDITTAVVTAPRTFESAMDPAINNQQVNDAPLAATTADWTQNPVLGPILGFAGVVLLFLPLIVLVIVACPICAVANEAYYAISFIAEILGLPIPPYPGASTATAEANPPTAPTLTGDPLLGDSSPDITATEGPADAAPGTEAGTAGVFATGLNASGDDISRSLSALNPFSTDQGDKQAGTDGENSGPQTLLPGLTKLTPKSLTDGFKFTPAKPGSAEGDNQTGGPAAKVVANVSDSLQQVANNVGTTVQKATDSVKGLSGLNGGHKVDSNG
jgi:hypothetical protein